MAYCSFSDIFYTTNYFVYLFCYPAHFFSATTKKRKLLAAFSSKADLFINLFDFTIQGAFHT